MRNDYLFNSLWQPYPSIKPICEVGNQKALLAHGGHGLRPSSAWAFISHCMPAPHQIPETCSRVLKSRKYLKTTSSFRIIYTITADYRACRMPSSEFIPTIRCDPATGSESILRPQHLKPGFSEWPPSRLPNPREPGSWIPTGIESASGLHPNDILLSGLNKTIGLLSFRQPQPICRGSDRGPIAQQSSIQPPY